MAARLNSMMESGQLIRLVRVEPREPRGRGVHAKGLLLLPILIAALASTGANAGLLNDEQLYFDPASMVAGYYDSTYLRDLYDNDTVRWDNGADPVVGAQILPVLKPGEYPPGYQYSQADYYQIPNVDYFADLTGGMLTARFAETGLYHVRVTRQSGWQKIYAVFAQAGGFPDPPEKTGDTKVVPAPDGDVFLVLKTTPDDAQGGAKNALDRTAELLERVFHKDVRRFRNRQQLEKIIGDFPEKKHAEIVTHGALYTDPDDQHEYGGAFCLGDQYLDSSGAAEFAKKIAPKVKYLTLEACWVGKGDEGKTFLQTLADSIGKVSAWDCWTGADWMFNKKTDLVTSGDFKAFADGKYVTKVPEPASLALLIVGSLPLLRRRAT
jgi:hypothetical protein